MISIVESFFINIYKNNNHHLTDVKINRNVHYVYLK